MNLEEFNKLKTAPLERHVIGIDDLHDKTPRTLIFGYDVSRRTFHVYIGKDGLIHVLQYQTFLGVASNETNQQFLIISHTYGTSGGLSDSSEYVPDKRVYPESCDYEFCRLLKQGDVHIPFTTFTEGADEARFKQFNGYAGLTHQDAGGDTTMDLHDELYQDPAFPKFPMNPTEVRELSARIILEACRMAQVPHLTDTPYSGRHLQIHVASSGQKLVLEKAKELLKSLENSTISEFLSDLGVALINKVFSNSWVVRLEDVAAYGGVLEFKLNYEAINGKFEEKATDAVSRIDGAQGAVRARLGYHKDRPFLVVLMDGAINSIYFSQFGDTNRFLTQYSRMYGLDIFSAL